MKIKLELTVEEANWLYHELEDNHERLSSDFKADTDIEIASAQFSEMSQRLELMKRIRKENELRLDALLNIEYPDWITKANFELDTSLSVERIADVFLKVKDVLHPEIKALFDYELRRRGSSLDAVLSEYEEQA